MAGNADINLDDRMVDEAMRLGEVMGDLSVCTEHLDSLISALQGMEAYKGKAAVEAYTFYAVLKNHVDTLTLLYGMALQQAFTSFSRIWEADEAGSQGGG